MKITHIGIWTKQLEVLRSFYGTVANIRGLFL